MATRARKLNTKKIAKALGAEIVTDPLEIAALRFGMTLDSMKPDELGYSRRQVIVKLIAEFDVWMTGQTYAIAPVGGAERYYPHDVDKFVGMIHRLIVKPGREITD